VKSGKITIYASSGWSETTIEPPDLFSSKQNEKDFEQLLFVFE